MICLAQNDSALTGRQQGFLLPREVLANQDYDITTINSTEEVKGGEVYYWAGSPGKHPMCFACCIAGVALPDRFREKPVSSRAWIAKPCRQDQIKIHGPMGLVLFQITGAGGWITATAASFRVSAFLSSGHQRIDPTGKHCNNWQSLHQQKTQYKKTDERRATY